MEQASSGGFWLQLKTLLFTSSPEMPQMLAIVLILGILYLGDYISLKTKAFIPSVFVCAVLFLLGYWSFFPTDLVARAGIPTVTAVLLIFLLIVNMGTLLSWKEMIIQWKTVVVALVSLVGVIIISYSIGTMFFDKNLITAAIPPLIGGVVSSIIMHDAALALGLEDVAVFALLIYVMQGFAGYSLTSVALKKEGRRVLDLHRKGQWKDDVNSMAGIEKLAKENALERPRMFSGMDAKFDTDYFKLFRIAVVGLIAYGTSLMFKTQFGIVVDQFVLCLLFGVIAVAVGFLERQPLQKANSMGFAMMGIMVFVFNGLSKASPDMLARLFLPLVVLIALAVIGMFIASFVIAFVLRINPFMAFSVALTALYGFPADYIITKEVVDNLTDDEAERKVLLDHMLPPMLIGGFVSVTIVSVILAGYMKGWLVAA